MNPRCVVCRRVQSLCPSGVYGATRGLTTAACSGMCAVGYECPAGSTNATAVVCPLGYFCGGGDRQPCPAGRFSDRPGATSVNNCTACGANTYSAVVGAVTALTCKACPRLEGALAGSGECWPGVVSAVASNPPPIVIGFSTGDVVTINLTRAVQVPADTARHVVFTPSIGAPVMSWQFGTSMLLQKITTMMMTMVTMITPDAWH